MGYADLDRYNVIVMVSGSYNGLGDQEVEKMKRLGPVNGGTLIATEVCHQLGEAQRPGQT
ncbi:MAG: hypothetical protein U5J63_14630 [Fodinibius sp.]|nr:hypothetical protein [Fodinibius sp.]